MAAMASMMGKGAASGGAPPPGMYGPPPAGKAGAMPAMPPVKHSVPVPDPKKPLTPDQEKAKTASFLAAFGRAPGNRMSTDLGESDDGTFFSRDDAFGRNSGG